MHGISCLTFELSAFDTYPWQIRLSEGLASTRPMLAQRRESMKFRKKPVVIEAVQLTEEMRDAIVLDGAECPPGVRRGATRWHQKDRKVWRAEFFIATLEGRMDVSLNDWIITGVKGEHYPCKPDIFEATYEVAELELVSG